MIDVSPEEEVFLSIYAVQNEIKNLQANKGSLSYNDKAELFELSESLKTLSNSI